jgi:hypothetical protein
MELCLGSFVNSVWDGRWVGSFTHRLLYFRLKGVPYPLIDTLVGPHPVRMLWKGSKILSLLRILPHFLQRLMMLLRLTSIKEFFVIQKKSFSLEIIRSIRWVKPGTYYPHVTWAHVMLRVQLAYVTLNSGAHSRFCHPAYVTWSNVEPWSAHMPASLLNFCWRTHFVRRDVRELTWREDSVSPALL